MTDAVAALRSVADDVDTPVVLPATDPLNLTSRLGSSERVPASPGYTIEIANGRVGAHGTEEEVTPSN